MTNKAAAIQHATALRQALTRAGAPIIARLVDVHHDECGHWTPQLAALTLPDVLNELTHLATRTTNGTDSG